MFFLNLHLDLLAALALGFIAGWLRGRLTSRRKP